MAASSSQGYIWLLPKISQLEASKNLTQSPSPTSRMASSMLITPCKSSILCGLSSELIRLAFVTVKFMH